MRRYFETLFRVREVFLIPLLVVPLIGLALAFASGSSQTVKAVVWVEPSVFIEQVRTDRALANQLEAQALDEWLTTEAFKDQLIGDLGLDARIAEGSWPQPSALQRQGNRLNGVPILGPVLRALGLTMPRNQSEAVDYAHAMIERTMSVAAEGNNLVRIEYNGTDPVLGRAMVAATIQQYMERSNQRSIADAQRSIEFYTNQVNARRDQLAEARSALNAFIAEHPAPIAPQVRPPAEQAELDSLTRSFELNQALYESALTRLDEVRLEAEAMVSDQTHSFQVIDEPKTPDDMGFSKRSIAMIIVIGLMIGGMIGGGAVVVLTWMDQTVRSPADVQRVLRTRLNLQAPATPDKWRRWPHIARLSTSAAERTE